MKTLLTYQKLIVALFAIVFTLTLHGVSDAQTYTHIHIDAVKGTNAPTGRGSAANPYKSITYALLISTKTNLPDPWHVHIYPGTYNSDPAKSAAEREVFPLNLRSDMIFEGTTTAEECIIDARHLGATRVEILLGLDSENVTIRNLTIQNMNNTIGSAAGGITLWSSAETIEDFSTIEGCLVRNNNPKGVRANVPLILTGNTFSSNGFGSSSFENRGGVLTSKNVVALRNTFSNNGEQHLSIRSDSVGDISDNIFAHAVMGRGRSGGGTSFRINGTLTGNVTGNTFDGNPEGIFVGTIVGNVTNNIFTGNGSFGFYVTRLTGNVTHNTFTNNGGGFHVREYLTGNVTHNTFTGNDSGREFYTGGGFGVQWGLRGNVTHNTFTSNKGVRFGGFYTGHLTGNVTHNVFDSNSVKEDKSSYASGGFSLGKKPTNVEVSNNIFYNNISGGDSGAVRTEQPTHFKNNLFLIHDAPSADGAVWLSSPECQFHNNIFSGMDTAIYTADPFDLLITHNLFHNIGLNMVSQGGSGLGNDLDFWELLATNAKDNLSGDPLLVSPVVSRDFHLKSTSPAIDAGTNAFAPADDLDGVARPFGATVDIGPYEYGGTPVITGQPPPDDEPPTETPSDEQVMQDDTEPQRLKEDVNGDGVVNIQDLVLVAASFGQTGETAADVNGDGTVNIADLVLVAGALGSTAAAPFAWSGSMDVAPPRAEVAQWLTQAQQLNLTDTISQRGIRFLEELLLALPPKETMLLANYPNPFNPETWIPYQLASPAAVTLHIHAVDGSLVRTLLLGHKTVGIYQSRSRAAYWDGKNEVGESVASGVYFYTLTADDFNATRKMLIRK